MDTSATAVQQWIAAWLVEKGLRSKVTVATYRKEAERFLLWLAQENLELLACRHEHASAYLDFLSAPPKHWVGKQSVPKDHEAWRPQRVRKLKPASLRVVRGALSSLYAYLRKSKLVQDNPFSETPPIRLPERFDAERVLWPREVEAALIWLEQQEASAQGAAKQAQPVRARWAFMLIVLTGLRRAEAARLLMGHFAQNEAGEWWVTVYGKGNKIRRVPLPDLLLQELARYRKSLGLPALPSRLETRPAIHPLRGESPLSGRAVYNLMRPVLAGAQLVLKAQGDSNAAAHLRGASTHWLRHTAATLKLAQGTPLEQVQADLGHASLETTQRYLHTEDRPRYLSAKRLALKPGKPG